jgi:hypothetical protein
VFAVFLPFGRSDRWLVDALSASPLLAVFRVFRVFPVFPCF